MRAIQRGMESFKTIPEFCTGGCPHTPAKRGKEAVRFKVEHGAKQRILLCLSDKR